MIDMPVHNSLERATPRDATPFLGIGVVGLIGLGLLLASPARRILTSPRGFDMVMLALRRGSVPIPIIAALASLIGMNREQIRRSPALTRDTSATNAF